MSSSAAQAFTSDDVRTPCFGTLSVSITGCPSGLGQPRKGVDEGPRAIRATGLADSLAGSLKIWPLRLFLTIV